MSTYVTATEPTDCSVCTGLIREGDEFVIDAATGQPIGYECGCGDPYYADGEEPTDA